MDGDKFTELAALHAINALDGEELQMFEQYLRTASEAERRELQELKDVWATLPLALPPTVPPSHLKARLMDRISEEVTGQDASPKVVEFSLRQKSRGLFGFFSWQPAFGLLTAATFLLAITSGMLLWHSSRVARERDQLAQQVAELSRLNVATQKQLDDLVTQTTKFISLSGKEAPTANAKVFWDTTRNEWVVYIFNLPAAPPDKDYQLWYVTSDQQKISAKVFGTDAKGRTELRIALPQNVAPRLAATAVTLEPKGGSPQPTSGLYLVGAIGA